MFEKISGNGAVTFSSPLVREQCGHDLCVTVFDPGLGEECRLFLEYVLACIQNGYRFSPGDTFKYGYWEVKVVININNQMEFWELEPDASDYICGITNTLSYWRSQHAVCAKIHARFEPIHPNQMVAISAGVYEGDNVQAVRYISPPHMSGWYITTDRYDGDINSLKVVHANHVSARRPDLAQFFGLPCGYRFDSADNVAWFDKKVLE